jgi:hypothetical protein
LISPAPGPWRESGSCTEVKLNGKEISAKGITVAHKGDRLQVFEFEGGHQWAPKNIVEKALDYVHAKLPK